jgi:hypothetical protein
MDEHAKHIFVQYLRGWHPLFILVHSLYSSQIKPVITAIDLVLFSMHSLIPHTSLSYQETT